MKVEIQSRTSGVRYLLGDEGFEPRTAEAVQLDALIRKAADRPSPVFMDQVIEEVVKENAGWKLITMDFDPLPEGTVY